MKHIPHWPQLWFKKPANTAQSYIEHTTYILYTCVCVCACVCLCVCGVCACLTSFLDRVLFESLLHIFNQLWRVWFKKLITLWVREHTLYSVNLVIAWVRQITRTCQPYIHSRSSPSLLIAQLHLCFYSESLPCHIRLIFLSWLNFIIDISIDREWSHICTLGT